MIVIIFLIGIIIGMGIHHLLLRKNKTINYTNEPFNNPKWCEDSQKCCNKVCLDYPKDCEYDKRG
jgi:hypothetical protein